LFFGMHRESMHAYVRALWADVARAETSDACAYIVDLRRNRGGNMWPNLLALQPLLGVGNVGAFRSRDDSVAEWGLEAARATLAGTTVIAVTDPPASMEAAATRPVAVLLGAETASSGEAIAIAFRARPSTRSFGYHTYGATTANTPFTLKDSAAVNLAIADSVDRAGAGYAPFVAPDEETTYKRIVARPGGARDVTKLAALEWLREGGCRQPPS
jgi:C-terminal processing protease CtpA/Prc